MLNKTTKKVLAVLSFIFVPVVIYIIYSLVIQKQEENQLTRESVIITAYITEVYVGTKSKTYVTYKFKVDDTLYTKSQRYFPNKEIYKIQVGDSCKAIYARTNPNISKLLTKKDGSLRIIRRIEGYVPFMNMKKDSLEW